MRAETLCDRVAKIHSDIYLVKLIDKDGSTVCISRGSNPLAVNANESLFNDRMIIIWSMLSIMKMTSAGLKYFSFNTEALTVCSVPTSLGLLVIVMSSNVPAEIQEIILAAVGSK